VTLATDGPAALQALEKSPPIELVILDLMLPGMSGYSVCETLRETGHNIPILILSARTLTEDRTRGFDVGANQYMTKPFDLEELLSRVKNLLTTHRQMTRQDDSLPLSRYEFAEARINFQTHEVSVRDQPVRMTQLELKLLKYFIENAGRVIPRQELLEEVWNMPGYANTRAPDQFIRRLRKTFEADPAKPVHFLTIRDAGYRFVPKP
jgi:two-component system OmpR family response regulator